MKFALMQPYFFPYLGYFSLIASVDHFMFFDDVQFIKKSWMTRNRLKNFSMGDSFYIRPALDNAPYQANLREVTIKVEHGWKKTLLDQLRSYKGYTSYFNQEFPFIEQLIKTSSAKNLVDLNMETTITLAAYLHLKAEFSVFGETEFDFENPPNASTWGLEVSKCLKASRYINSPGGESFIFPEGFSEAGIKLGFIKPNIHSYPQGEGDFIPGLSILDVLLFNGRERTIEMIKDYSIKWLN